MRRPLTAGLILAMTSLLFAIPGASAQQQATMLNANLAALNTSDATGTAQVSVSGDQVTVTIRSRGLSANLPHAQHIHIGGQHTCPTPGVAGDDNLISTAEGQPAYGPVRVSLTTTGAVDAASALAVDRFPTADANGTLAYSRTFTLPEGVTAADVRQGVIVQHGISKLFDDPAQYDGAPRSSLDPNLPLEATIPATCGALEAVSSQPGTLAPLNTSGATGTANVSLDGDQLTVKINATGLAPNLPHAQHIHIGGQHSCPAMNVAGEDNLISTAEGQPAYGPVRISLTTAGAVDAGSALAVDRFPTADANGNLAYSRTFALPAGVTAADVRQGVIVQHGISKLFDDQAQYDGAPRSSLDPNLPLEATIPATCGTFQVAAAQMGTTPQGGVATGAGGTAPTTATLPVALAVALIGAVGVFGLGLSRASTTR